jgi:quercetin dioxygenase-like cupin family protein
MFHRETEEGCRPLADGVEIKSLVHGETTHMVVFRLAAGSRVLAHRHPHEQTGFLVSGQLALTIGGLTRELGPGDAWSIPADTDHAAEALSAARAVEVFSPVDDLLLVVGVQVHEVVAVAGHAHQQVAVLLGTGLGLAQRGAVHDVELDVVAVETEIGPDEPDELVQVLFTGQDIGQQPLVEQGAARFELVHLASDLITAVGPLRSAPWEGEVPSDSGRPARRPLGVAPSILPK